MGGGIGGEAVNGGGGGGGRIGGGRLYVPSRQANQANNS